MSAAPVRVLVGVLVGDEVPAPFAYDLARLTGYTAAMRPDIELSLVFLRTRSRADAQHALGYNAMSAGSTHLLLIDPELRFPKNALIRLLDAMAPIVGANYPTRDFPIRPTANVLVEGTLKPLYVGSSSSGLKEVAQLELGLTLIRVDVLKSLPLPQFQEWFDPQRGEFLEPDAFFCRHATHNGVPLLVDLSLSQEVSRLGSWEFKHEHALQMYELDRQDQDTSGGVLDKR
jgi:hypothetical protein